MEDSDDEIIGLEEVFNEFEDIADAEEEYVHRVLLTIAGTIIAGTQHSSDLRNLARHPHCLYLVRSQLLPDPRVNTPWQRLFQSRDDRGFITTMGVNVDTFDFILRAGFAQQWFTRPIPRNSVNALVAIGRPSWRSLDAAGALGLVLHYLNSTMCEISLQQIFALIPATVSCYIHFGLSILLQVLRDMPDASIEWPAGSQFAYNNTLIIQRHPRLTGAFGSIDGLKLPIQTSNDPEIENATYNGWLSEHFISSVLAFSAEGVIVAARINVPGSWHDSRVARPIYEKLQSDTPPGFYLVADTAFPRGTSLVDGRIRAPLKEGQQVTGTLSEIEEQMAFNRELLSFRQTAEWGMRSLQGAFGCLRVPLDINDEEGCSNLIEICVRLHNLRATRVGIGQIRQVYMQQWQETAGDRELWAHFEDMLFSEQQWRDRVSRFHVRLEYEDSY